MPGNAAIGNLAVNLSLETAQFTDGATKAQASMRALSGSAERMAGGFRSFSMSAGNARVVGLELTHITRSLGEQLAMGVSPARAFASEIGRIGTAVQYAGGIGGLGRAIVGMIAPFSALAAGAGILAAAFLSVKQAADSADMKAYIATLGLTDAQIKRLKDTTVTWGDVTKATFQVLAEKAGTSANAVSGAFSRAFTSVGEFAKFAASILLASFGAAVKGVADVVTNLPNIVGGAVVAAANLAIAALEKMVNLGVAGLNKLSGTINGVLGTSLGQVADVSLGRIQNNFGSTMKAIGADVSGTFHGIFNRTEATFSEISARAVQIRKSAIAAEAAALREGEAAGRGAKGHEDHAKAVKKDADAMDLLRKRLDESLAKEAAVNDDLKNPKPIPRVEVPDIVEPLEKAKSAWQEWADTVPQQAAQISEAFQGIAFRGLDGIAGAIGDVISGARSLKSAFGDVAKSIIADLVQMAAKMLIFRAVSAIFGGPQLNIPTETVFGVTLPGTGTPGMANGGTGVFGGFPGVDRNILSLNGSPIARVSKGESFSVSRAANDGITVNQTFAPQFAGNAATKQDLVQMAVMTKSATIQAIREQRRRSGRG